METQQSSEPVPTHKTLVQLVDLLDDSYERKPCSYCKSTRGLETDLGFYSTAFTTNKLRADDFEDFILRGFTRSGTYLYVRSILKSCCEVYSYRIDADQFEPSKSQKKALVRFHRYLQTGLQHADQQDSKMQQKKPQTNLELQFKESVEKFLTVRGAWFAEHIDGSKHKVYLRGNMLSSNALHLLSESQWQCLSQNVLDQLCEQLQSLEQGSKSFIKDKFINLQLSRDYLSKQKQTKLKPHVQQINSSEKDYLKYYRSFVPNESTAEADKVQYTVSIHKAIFTDELFELYQKYELQVHNRSVTESTLRSHLCNSPVYDPLTESLPDNTADDTEIDINRVFKDEGVDVKSRGSYHMYHRLDGKLVAVGNLDLLQNVLNSGYFIYDPDLKFLNLGVVGALKELEYIKRVRESQNKYKWYVLGDLVARCTKVNYKLQYQPGYVVCPRTKVPVPYHYAESQMKAIENCTIDEKLTRGIICLCNQNQELTHEETIIECVRDQLEYCPILYNSNQWITCQQIFSPEIKARFLKGMFCLLRESGLNLFRRLQFVLNIKTSPQQNTQPEQPEQEQSEPEDVILEEEQSKAEMEETKE